MPTADAAGTRLFSTLNGMARRRTLIVTRMALMALMGLVAMSVPGACSTDLDSGVTAQRSTRAEAGPAVSLPDTGTTGPTVDDPPPATTDEPSITDPAVAPTTTDGPAPPTSDGASDTGDGVGDVLYPALGNPGVDVRNYVVDISYDRAVGVVEGTVTLDIVFTEAREDFTLDSIGPEVSRVTIDGADVDFELDEPELRITPEESIVAGDEHEVLVEYVADPERASSLSGLPSGWFTTAGGSYVLNEPDGARTWLPSNDHPSDKATWTFRITVPDGVTAVANGRLVSTTPGDRGTTWEWREADPMPTYLILAVTGDYEIVESQTTSGIPLVSVVLRDDLTQMRPFLDGMDELMAFLEQQFGPYPLDRYGLAIADSFGGLAMETQGRSLFSRDDLRDPDGFFEQLLLSHELAHQWFGNAVSPAVWGDIWLNESFASYAQWMWLEHIGLTTVAREADLALQNRQAGRGDPTGSPPARDLFGYNSYEGGAVVLHALRLTVGDDAFFELLRRWVAENEGTSRTTGAFIALAEEVSGAQLDDVFDVWLFADPPPTTFPPAG